NTTVRPASADSVTELSSVASRMTGGIAMPTRCAAAPSSVGAGILLQSTSSRFFWFMDAILHQPSLPATNAKRLRKGAKATKQSILPCRTMDCFASLAMTDRHISRSSPRPHQAAFFPAPVAFLFALALVVQLLALGDRQQELGPAAFVEIQF